MNDVFFFNIRTASAAEPTITNTNLVAIIVDKDIYSDLEDDIKTYATDYVQQKISDSKAIVLPIDINNFQAPDIVKILENMYFDGIQDEPSKLV
ncbi:hypothetical protein KKG31_07885 [Patescibacteria group bacterium]|nr:hypothetical protein [Patescibacteria group bacterium]MBU1758986.1 hypothetical protein [Patescibacteria group bacterium]